MRETWNKKKPSFPLCLPSLPHGPDRHCGDEIDCLFGDVFDIRIAGNHVANEENNLSESD